MKLTSLHLLLTYKCTLSCGHCFVWGSPIQEGKMSFDTVATILSQAKQVEGIESIIFEGGEPFLCYPVLVAGIQEAYRLGFDTGIVSNGYWANTVEVAIEKLRPLAGCLGTLTISCDRYHEERLFTGHAQNALTAARRLGIPCDVIEIAPPGASNQGTTGQIPAGTSGVMYRGRAAEKLVHQTRWQPWDQFNSCPYENLRDPGRVHIDPYGNLHICEGIVSGNLLSTPLRTILERYVPESHPIVGPIYQGGPAELCRAFSLPHEEQYADACHLCYLSRKLLRKQFPKTLAPDQVYGVVRLGSVKGYRLGVSLATREPAPVIG